MQIDTSGRIVARDPRGGNRLRREQPARRIDRIDPHIEQAAATVPGVTVDIRRLLLAHALQPLPGNRPLVESLQRHGEAVFGEPIPTSGTPLYTDVRLYGAQGIPAVIYGAGPRTVLESNAKRADEHLALADLKRATRVVARALHDLEAAREAADELAELIPRVLRDDGERGLGGASAALGSRKV